ncbi:hypothetical protein [Roseibium litorale]|uniref:Uncharacterized protein n=1 Tax=Roseibium litorale TaxID=2803841 RepID=A0ABR9CPS7_9HYPH|nr:hypothetical protein [Roseibium litorale]MBD8892674.1 hypothetical protein [Roseibium litorale]
MAGTQISLTGINLAAFCDLFLFGRSSGELTAAASRLARATGPAWETLPIDQNAMLKHQLIDAHQRRPFALKQ